MAPATARWIIAAGIFDGIHPSRTRWAHHVMAKDEAVLDALPLGGIGLVFTLRTFLKHVFRIS